MLVGVMDPTDLVSSRKVLSRNHFAVVHVPLGWKILEPPAGGTEKLIGSYDR
jgi:hypothetical protein